MKTVEKLQDWASMPVLPSDFIMASYSEATAISPTASKNTYTADIKRDWCIGVVPHGGYLMSTAACAVKLHFQTHHKTLNQPDLITFHIEFLSRTAIGTGTFQIHELKLGRQFSTVRIQLVQSDPSTSKSRICFEALVTQGNLLTEAASGGISLPTRPYPYLTKENLLKREDCEEWHVAPEWIPRRPAALKTELLLPKGSDSLGAHPTLGPSVREQWVRWKPDVGSRFDVGSLAYLADAFRPLGEAYGMVGNWYPTMSYGMEVKRRFDGEGWEWLFLRIEMHEVRNGRFDLEVLIADEEGQLVAISRHTALIVGSERNYKGRAEKI